MLGNTPDITMTTADKNVSVRSSTYNTFAQISRVYKIIKSQKNTSQTTLKSFDFMGTKFRGKTTMDMFVDILIC